ncbi:MAG TPA: hypothetical protein VKG26_10510, partial [Bacteroidia bacterium]|nr:hypothetical protein [Bacteroidia bacterium]
MGNVINVVSDNKIGQVSGTTIAYYKADPYRATDYYAFGQPMADRNFANDEGTYRYGFNGKEQDDEVHGIQGAAYTAEYWEYDARLGRRWNQDPMTKKFPFQSPYMAFNGNPILYADPTGAVGEPSTGGVEHEIEHPGADPPAASKTEGLTTDKLRALGRAAGITGTGVDFNRKVGKAFETMALAEFNVLGKQKGHATPDRFAKYGVGATTIPDASSEATYVYSTKMGTGIKTIPNAS